MDLNYVKRLMKLLSESEVDEIEIEEEGKRIRLARHAATAPGVPAWYPPSGVNPVAVQGVPVTSPSVASPSALPPSPEGAGHHEIKSPIVGTFYRAPSPDAVPFVQVGSSIQPGTALCIIEAMKLMNEIEADVAGKIVKILVENGQPVEYDQTLFLVEKS